MNTQTAENLTVVYWHRDLPPLAAEVLGEHVVEASSGRVSTPEMADAALRLGAYRVVPKPFEVHDVVNLVLEAYASGRH